MDESMDESTSLLPLCIGAAEAGGSVAELREMRALVAEAALRRMQGAEAVMGRPPHDFDQARPMT
jgi:hypothetical protein